MMTKRSLKRRRRKREETGKLLLFIVENNCSRPQSELLNQLYFKTFKTFNDKSLNLKKK